jgi:hypothetical protein
VSNYETLDSRYDEFLFAEIGEQQNGMPMSMASALTRLGLDPWEEAARLAAMPAAAAVGALSARVARMSDLTLRASESKKLVAGLVPLLARGARPSANAAPARAAPWWHAFLQIEPRWLKVAIAVGVIVAAARLFFSG